MAKQAKLEARIGLNSTKFRRGLTKLKGMAASFAAGFGRALLSVGRVLAIGLVAGIAAATAGFAVLIKKTATYGDMLDKMSKRIGVSTDFLQKLKHAAELGGSTLQAMEKSIRTLAKATAEADDGMATYADEFKKLGVNVRSTSGELKSTEDIFVEVAEALSKVENSTKRVSIAQQLLGRSGGQVLSIMSDGAKGFAEAMQEAEDLGLIMSKQDIANAARFNDEMTRTTGLLGGLGRNFAAKLLPSLNAALVAFRVKIKEMEKEGVFANLNVKLEEGAALLLAAFEVFSKSSTKLATLGDIIWLSLKSGADVVAAKIREAFGGTALGKALGFGSGVVRAAGAAVGGVSTGQRGTETGKQIAAAFRNDGKKASKEVASDYEKGMKEIMARMESSAGLTMEEAMASAAEVMAKARGALGVDAAPQQPRQFSDLRKIGANIISGAQKNVEEKQLSQLEKMQKKMTELVQVIKDRNAADPSAKF